MIFDVVIWTVDSDVWSRMHCKYQKKSSDAVFVLNKRIRNTRRRTYRSSNVTCSVEPEDWECVEPHADCSE